MSQQKRKIGYYLLFLHKKHKRNQKINPTTTIEKFLVDIMVKPQNERILDTANDKFYFIDSVKKVTLPNQQHAYQGFFKSAKYNHRPPLISKDTATERANPKTLIEGEAEKTHFVLKIDNATQDIIILLEERKSGIGFSHVYNYFKDMPATCGITLQGILATGMIPVDNFLDEFNTLQQVKVANISYKKQAVGSQFAEFANLSSEAKDEIVISASAKRGSSIKAQLFDAVTNFTTGTTSVASKIRIYGINEAGNYVKLDSELCKKKNYVTANLDDITKVVTSDLLLEQIVELIEEI